MTWNICPERAFLRAPVVYWWFINQYFPTYYTQTEELYRIYYVWHKNINFNGRIIDTIVKKHNFIIISTEDVENVSMLSK